jgi:tripartite-type tricarboxylate transporter receptor subunit TctC
MPVFSRRQILGKAAGAAALAAMSRGASADDYPTRRIRLVIPYIAGGSGDQIGRLWIDKVGPLLGPIYAENISGAGGAIGCAAVAQSPADGYTLVVGNGSTQVMIPVATSHPVYDTGDFQAIYRLITSTLAFAIHPSLPVRDLQELVAYAKASPGKLSYGTPGVGTGNHLIGEMFKQQTGATDIVHVPYRGMTQATNDLVAGQIPVAIAVVSGQVLQLHETGKIRILAVTSEKRLGSAPRIPTVAESAMPELGYAGWFGLFAPKATPRAILERIAEVTRTAMADPALQEAYRAQGMEPDINSSPDKFQQLVENELARLAPVIKSIGLKRD